MIKKLLICLFALVPVLASAALAVGSWNLYAPFSSIDKMVETKGMVYYLSSGSLYSIDKETDEVATLNSSTKLTDNEIQNIYYNPTSNCLMVAYTSGNIDKLYDDGKLVNLPDIRDAVMTYERNINDIAFGKENFYVTTTFGLVIFSDRRNEVRSTVYRDGGLTGAAELGDKLLVTDGKQIYEANVDDKLMNFNQFSKIVFSGSGEGDVPWTKLASINDKYAVGRVNWLNGQLYKIEKRADGTYGRGFYRDAAGEYVQDMTEFQFLADGTLRTYNGDTYMTIDTEGNATFSAIPEILKGQVLSAMKGMSEVWAGDAQGVSLYDISNPSSPVEKKGKTGKSEYSVKNVNYLTLSPTGRIYVSNCSSKSRCPDFANESNASRMLTLNVIEDGVVTNVTPTYVEVPSNKDYKKLNLVSNPYKVVEDPDNPDALYIATKFDGIFRVAKDPATGEYKQTHNYYKNSSTLKSYANSDWAYWVGEIAFDKWGNLWTVIFTENSTLPAVHMLSKEGRKKATTTPEDWVALSIPNMGESRNSMIIPTPDGQKLVMTKGVWSTHITVYDPKGTASTADDTWTQWTSFVDQDGKTVEFNHIGSIMFDKRGYLWVGTDNGVFEIQNLNQTNTSTALVNHIKVPRNDGTNLADYLLNAQSVIGMACDSSNRKWLSTMNAGVYLVSETGDEILENFTTENSSLPDNQVYAVACDPTSNSVYFGTDYGMVEYSSSSSPAATDYSDVYAYPNPVRPDYGGWITVKGLMDNSLVKIMDSAGNLVAMGRSDGGMFVWDGCNGEGNRVKTGVYYVYASQNEDGGSSGAVTKIMVVN